MAGNSTHQVDVYDPGIPDLIGVPLSEPRLQFVHVSPTIAPLEHAFDVLLPNLDPRIRVPDGWRDHDWLDEDEGGKARQGRPKCTRNTPRGVVVGDNGGFG